MADRDVPRPGRAALRRIAQIAFTMGLLGLSGLAVREVDFRHVGAQLAALPRTTVLLAALLSVGQALAMATRLWSVFPEGTRPAWARVARAFGFGQLANACLPGRAGDVIKVVAMARPAGARGGGAAGPNTVDAMGVMLTDKAVDVATLTMLVTAFAPTLLAGMTASVLHMTWIAAVAALLAAGGTLALRRWRPGVFGKVRHAALVTCGTVRALLTPRRLLLALTLGVCAWVAEATSMQVLSAQFGVRLSIPQAMVGLLVLNVGIAVPVSVANVGAYEAATVVGLVPFGASAPQALAIGAIHHAVQVGTIALFALAFWVRDRLVREQPSLKTPEAPTEACEGTAAE